MFNLLNIFKKEHKIKPVVLVVLDGFGVAPASEGNAVTKAKTPNYLDIQNHYPMGQLIASGEAVGLPTNEVGNTEVGHLTIGAGRVILQDLKRINEAIERGTFYDNRALVAAANHVKSNKSKLHIMGLVSSGKVHSSIDHLYAVLQFCKKEGIENVYVHAFTDGRDASPKEGVEIIKKLDSYLDTLRIGKIASVAGRYYAMDRDRRWQRTEKVYKALVLGRGNQSKSAVEAVENAYGKGQTDEFIEPCLIVDPNGTPNLINDNDAVLFFNYRIDRAKQLTLSFVVSDFENPDSAFLKNTSKKDTQSNDASNATFQREKVLKNLFFVTMTEYEKNLPGVNTAFGPEAVVNPLTLILSNLGLNQMHMSESEKERFVTYYFDGMCEDKQKGEEVLIVPSPKVATYDLMPEMSLPKLVKAFKKELNRDKYHFFVLNFANADMIAHTGNLKAAVSAIEYIDSYLNDLVKSVLKYNGVVIVTADHGNSEEMLTFPSSTFFYTTASGSVNTDHSNNPVPVHFIANHLYDVKVQVPKGQLSDVAPTILKLMGLEIPKEMTGKNLLEGLNTPEKSQIT